jgi:hypothetical protein
MHDLVIGLFVNRYEFGRLIEHAIYSSATPSFLAEAAYARSVHRGERRNAARSPSPLAPTAV